MTTQTAFHPDQISGLVRSLVQLTAEHTGRGPTKVRTTAGPDLVCVVLSDALTKSERLLISAGRGELVGDLRRAYFCAMRPALLDMAREITGRDVLAVLGDHSVDPDISSVSFVFAPELKAYAGAPEVAPTARDLRDEQDPRELAVG